MTGSDELRRGSRCVDVLVVYVIGDYNLYRAMNFVPGNTVHAGPSIMTPTPAKRALPSKESSLFRELLNLYETRQLKKGQKAADQILKKFPEHGGPYNLTMDEPV